MHGWLVTGGWPGARSEQAAQGLTAGEEGEGGCPREAGPVAGRALNQEPGPASSATDLLADVQRGLCPFLGLNFSTSKTAGRGFRWGDSAPLPCCGSSSPCAVPAEAEGLTPLPRPSHCLLLGR